MGEGDGGHNRRREKHDSHRAVEYFRRHLVLVWGVPRLVVRARQKFNLGWLRYRANGIQVAEINQIFVNVHSAHILLIADPYDRVP